MTGTGKLAFQSENERLLEKVRAGGIELRSFGDWKQRGKWVKRGEKQKAYRVKSGVVRVGTDIKTGEDLYEPKMKTAYGFTAEQVN